MIPSRIFYNSVFLIPGGLPSKISSEIWNMPGYFHVYFNVSSGTPETETTPAPTREFNPFQPPAPTTTKSTPVNIISAKLKLYKKGTGSSNQVYNLEITYSL